uniref:Transposase n=1 Tax=uncultured Nitrospirae bacterium MY4-5C TaxID=798580 RepID=D9MP80_9BACT|nr:transposase [uncultured Nitrospirae bacterium MY4-5C]ADI87781.1 transposase [uncultured Nitrospirae bacterium MY4-5C]ADI87791.1 transposase [uncultured Nitrospirae bacterium MY4-5C]
MAIRECNRYQLSLLPASIEDYVTSEDPVRLYDEFVNLLDMRELGIEVIRDKVGNPQYDPRIMLKLIIYAYSYGWRSSRKIERALYHNLSFIWLTGGLKPDHKTISKFRSDNKDALKKVLKQCVKICMELKLIEGNTLFIDGSKIRANASIKEIWTDERCEEFLKKLDIRIEELIKECESADKNEEGTLAKLPEELIGKEKLKKRIEGVLEKLKAEEKKQINAVDEDSVKVKGRQGSHAGYNAQIAVDEKNGLIVNSDVVNENNDIKQLSDQVKQANEVLGSNCETVCADSGYSNTETLKEVLEEGIVVVVPSQRQALHEPKELPFSKDKFKYDEENNQYICPENKILKYSHYSKGKGHYLYRMQCPSNCINCRYFGECTDSKRGRAIIRLKHEKIREEVETIYLTPEGQEIYKKRKEKVELPFGHIKRNLNGWAFLLRGLKGVNAEMAILSTCFNISRMVTIIGIKDILAVFRKRNKVIQH